MPGIVGFGAATVLAVEGRDEERARLGALRDRFEAALGERLEGVWRNGPAGRRLAHTANLRFEGVDADSLLRRLPDVAASAAAACTTASLRASHVLMAQGLTLDEARASLRFSLGRFTTAEEVERAVALVAAAVERERAEGPIEACG